MMSVLDCRIGICFSLVLQSDWDMFLITVPSFPASFRRTLHRRAGWGTEMGSGRRREYDSPPSDALQIVLWQVIFYKMCYPEPPLKMLVVF